MDESTNDKTSPDKADVIIIGGGASGLEAGKEIAKAGKKVYVLEARNRLGGRIYTLTVPGFSTPLEAGAEFVHGDMPATQSLLRAVSYTHLRAHETRHDLVCRLLLA